MKKNLCTLICFVFLTAFIFGCGATYREQVVDKDGNVVATPNETDMGYWGIDSKKMTEYEKCLVKHRGLPGNMAQSMCTEAEVVDHSRDLYGVPQMSPYGAYPHYYAPRGPNPYIYGY